MITNQLFVLSYQLSIIVISIYIHIYIYIYIYQNTIKCTKRWKQSSAIKQLLQLAKSCYLGQSSIIKLQAILEILKSSDKKGEG